MIGPVKKMLLIGKHTCPWWLAYAWDNRIRTHLHDTDILLKPYLRPGMTALDVGCGMGYFSIRMAQYVGEEGKVLSVDIQEEMLEILQRRAEKRRLDAIIEPVLSRGDLSDIREPIDFALNFWMLHEVDSQETLVAQTHDLLQPGGKYLIAEPKIHTGSRYFASVIAMGRRAGFRVEAFPRIVFSRSVLLAKSENEAGSPIPPAEGEAGSR